MGKYDKMIWIDFESNGLHKDGPVCPLELGIIVTDREANELRSYSSLVLPSNWQTFVMSDFVRDMHTKSGLMEDIAAASNPTGWAEYAPYEVEKNALAWLQDGDELQAGEYAMSGSTITFDRLVMLEWFPNLNKFFHYRNNDVSSVKNLCRQLNPSVASKLPPAGDSKTHRVLDDIRMSIKELKFYMDNFLWVDIESGS